VLVWLKPNRLSGIVESKLITITCSRVQQHKGNASHHASCPNGASSTEEGCVCPHTPLLSPQEPHPCPWDPTGPRPEARGSAKEHGSFSPTLPPLFCSCSHSVCHRHALLPQANSVFPAEWWQAQGNSLVFIHYLPTPCCVLGLGQARGHTEKQTSPCVHRADT
jgi:hypothetical protein